MGDIWLKCNKILTYFKKKVLFLKWANIPVRIIAFIFFIISEFKFVALIAILRDVILTFAFYGKI